MIRENSYTFLEVGKWRVSGKGFGGFVTLKVSDRRNFLVNSYSLVDYRVGVVVDKFYVCF